MPMDIVQYDASRCCEDCIAIGELLVPFNSFRIASIERCGNCFDLETWMAIGNSYLGSIDSGRCPAVPVLLSP